MMDYEKATISSRRDFAHIPAWRRFLGIFTVASVLLFLTFREPLQAALATHRTCKIQPSNSAVYAKERGLIWEPCGRDGDRKLECSRLDVPMDQFNASNSGDRTFSLPLIRMRGNDDAKNLLINPGGPGGSGVQFVYNAGKRLSTIVGPDYHILGFDPRGVNGSRPLASCYPTAESREKLSLDKTDYHPAENSRDTYAWTKGFVQACAETLGEHGKYINTLQTAADMNSILDAVGQDEMIYWGFSYGTLLGQTYASLFPERSYRVIIDGVVNFYYWYKDVFAGRDALVDIDKVLFGIFDECLKAGEECPLSSFAKSATELQSKVLDFAFSLEEPLPVYLNNSNWGILKPENIIFNGIFLALYSPKGWWTFADRLAQLLRGNATEAFLAWGGANSILKFDTAESNLVITMNDVYTGPQHWPQQRQQLLDVILPFANSTIFGPFLVSQFYEQQQWMIPKTHHFNPPATVKTAHPLLILSATYDPVTPLESARLAQDIFQGSQIIEREGYGHSSIAMPSTCVAKHIRAFLYNGTVPTEYTKCERDGSYFVKPEDEATMNQNLQFKSSEDKAIYHAQLEMAQDPTWPYIF